MKKGSIHAVMIQEEAQFQARLREADRIKHNKKIVDADRYFHRVYGYLPDDLPDNTRGMIV